MKQGSVFVGITKVWLEIPGCKSLKEKRGIVKPLIHQVRKKYHVCVSEIGQHDAWRWCVMGICLLGNRSQDIERYLSTIIEDVCRHRRSRLLDYRTEIMSAGSASMCQQLRPDEDAYLKSLEEAWIDQDGEGGGK